jgi:hypothetical protein
MLKDQPAIILPSGGGVLTSFSADTSPLSLKVEKSMVINVSGAQHCSAGGMA